MASIVGVSSLYRSPCLELPKRASEKPHFCGLRASATSRGSWCSLWSSRPRAAPPRLLVPSAVASPNSVLSEEAFKGLGDFSKSSLDGEEGEDRYYGSEEEEAAGGSAVMSEEELAIANLGLPEQLVNTLEKRGITHLFPIQVMRRMEIVYRKKIIVMLF